MPLQIMNLCHLDCPSSIWLMELQNSISSQRSKLGGSNGSWNRIPKGRQYLFRKTICTGHSDTHKMLEMSRLINKIKNSTFSRDNSNTSGTIPTKPCNVNTSPSRKNGLVHSRLIRTPSLMSAWLMVRIKLWIISIWQMNIYDYNIMSSFNLPNSNSADRVPTLTS